MVVGFGLCGPLDLQITAQASIPTRKHHPRLQQSAQLWMPFELYREIKIFCDESKLREWMDFPCPGNKDFLTMNRFELSKAQELVVIQVCTIHLLDQLHTAKQKQQYTYISRTIIFTKVHLQFTLHLELTNPSTVTYADNCG